MSESATHLRIHWEAHGGRGNGPWQPIEHEKSVKAWLIELKRSTTEGSFSIERGTPSNNDLNYRPFPR